MALKKSKRETWWFNFVNKSKLEKTIIISLLEVRICNILYHCIDILKLLISHTESQASIYAGFPQKPS